MLALIKAPSFFILMWQTYDTLWPSSLTNSKTSPIYVIVQTRAANDIIGRMQLSVRSYVVNYIVHNKLIGDCWLWYTSIYKVPEVSALANRTSPTIPYIVCVCVAFLFVLSNMVIMSMRLLAARTFAHISQSNGHLRQGKINTVWSMISYLSPPVIKTICDWFSVTSCTHCTLAPFFSGTRMYAK